MGSSLKTVRQLLGEKRKAPDSALKSATEATVAAIMATSKKPLIFISWSGPREKKIAKRLQSFLEKHLPVRTFFSTRDLHSNEPGWKEEINRHLKEASYGIVCLTESNKTAPWIMYESGALDCNLNFRNVSLIAFDFEAAKLSGPFTNKHIRFWNKDEFIALIGDICRGLNILSIPDISNKEWNSVNRSVKYALASNPKEPASEATDAPASIEKDTRDKSASRMQPNPDSQKQSSVAQTRPMEMVKITGSRTVPLDGKQLTGGKYYWLTQKAATILIERGAATKQDPDDIVYMGVYEQDGVNVYDQHRTLGWCGKVRLGYAVDLQEKHKVSIHLSECVGIQLLIQVACDGKWKKAGDIHFVRLDEARQREKEGWWSILHFSDSQNEPPHYTTEMYP